MVSGLPSGSDAPTVKEIVSPTTAKLELIMGGLVMTGGSS
jgi:hypothetical protein